MLEIHDLHAGYGDVLVLHGVEFSVREGEIVAILGNNGAGKTTTLKTLMGLVNATGGGVRFLGEDITNFRPDLVVSRGIRLVAEGRRIFGRLSVYENLALGGYTLQSRIQLKEGVERAFQMFPILGERLHQPAGTLSGGEQQMLAIARALMTHPRLLILDEPSMGLAPQVVDFVFGIIRDIHKAGTTVLLVEQNAHLALEVADRAYVLENGTIAMSGSTAEMLDSERLRMAYLGN